MENESPEGPASTPAERAVDRALERRRAAHVADVQRLVTAAFVLIQRTGELEPRVSEIVRAAGLSNQAFYRHFRSKHELLVAVLDEGVRMLAGYVGHRMSAVDEPVARVREWLRGMLEQALDREAAVATRPFALSRARLAEAYPAEVAASERQLTAPLLAALEAGVASGALVGSDPGRDARILYDLALGWMQARLVDPEPPSRADAERLVEFAIQGLRPGPAV